MTASAKPDQDPKATVDRAVYAPGGEGKTCHGCGGLGWIPAGDEQLGCIDCNGTGHAPAPPSTATAPGAKAIVDRLNAAPQTAPTTGRRVELLALADAAPEPETSFLAGAAPVVAPPAPTTDWREETCTVSGDDVNRAWAELEKSLGLGPDALVAPAPEGEGSNG